jgi:drug/metabolite transporter (DMT)-like permease
VKFVARLAATWIVWGSTYFAITIALVSFPPFFQIGTRLLVAGALLFLWVSWRGQAMPTLVQWRNAAVVGTLMPATRAAWRMPSRRWLRDWWLRSLPSCLHS